MSITTSIRRYTPKEQMILDAGIAMGKEEERKMLIKELKRRAKDWKLKSFEELKFSPENYRNTGYNTAIDFFVKILDDLRSNH